MKKIGTILGLLSACIFAFGGDGSGQAGAYLRMGIGARALGMGGAFVAVSDDAYAAYWNPAGLAKLEATQSSFMHARLKMDRNFDFINYIDKNNEKNSALGFSIAKFGVDNIPETRIWRLDENNRLTSDAIFGNPYFVKDSSGDVKVLPVLDEGDTNNTDWIYEGAKEGDTTPAGYNTDWKDPDQVTAGDLETVDLTDPEIKIFSQFDDSETAFFVSYAKAFENLYFGANLKYMEHKLHDYTADGLSFDVGMLYDYSKRLTIGLSIRDIAGEMKWNTPARTTDTIPITSTLGIAYYIEHDWVVALDYNKIQNMDGEIFFGTERWLNSEFAVRAGSYDGDLSGGLTYVHDEWSFEYAFSEQTLGDIHRFSTTKTFK
ncbi:MAG: hypothetical protein ACQESP_04580 [Candidatus Muiribacteriota bacterium]